MNRDRAALEQFLEQQFGATTRNVTIWTLESVSNDMEKTLKDLRRVENKNQHNRRLYQIMEEFKGVKAKLDEEIAALKTNSEAESSRLDSGINN